MPFLVAAVVIVGLLCLLDLLLTVGVIRRLREHDEHLTRLLTGAGGRAGLPVGATVPDIRAESTRGEPIAFDSPAGTVVAFFSTTCQPCEEMVPEFLAYAAALPGGRDRVVAVVVGEEGAGAVKTAALGDVARVVTEPLPNGPVCTAFNTSTFPSVYVVSPERRILTTGHGMDVLATPAPVGVA